ncbi:MAG: glutamate 5-kinase [Ilumatobacteraceae bacterium]|nr:glutamate 5-kinase [Ilumatobacteraceae bacterium]
MTPVRIVVKIGTSSLTDGLGVIDRAAIAALSDQVAAVRSQGHDVVVVSSGAVSAGVGVLGLSARPTDMTTLQALAALGQPRLMDAYATALERHGIVPAQVLLDPHDFVDRRQYLHARRTVERLLELGCVPVVNENDAVANEELRYGDNDRLAALVAHNVAADLLVLLTDLDGLYTADPRSDPGATLVAEVRADDPLLAIAAGSSGTDRGSGGMASKLTAARIASWSGIRTVIARATRPDVLVDAVAGEAVGTAFEAHRRHLPARKLWIAFASRVAGAVVVDDGARRALTERATSLLPAGVTEVVGTFGEGDTVEVRDTTGAAFARGLVYVSSAQLREVAGRHTRDLPEGVVHEVVHRDDLVLLPSGG